MIGAANFGYEDLNSVAYGKAFAGNLFGFEQDCLACSGIHDYVAGVIVDLCDKGCNDLLALFLVFANDIILFSFAYSLDDDLLCGLCAESTEGLCFHFDFVNAAQLVFAADLFSFLQRYLSLGIFNLFDDIETAIYPYFLFVFVDHNVYVCAIGLLFNSTCESGFDSLIHILLGNSSCFFESVKRVKKFGVHLYNLLPRQRQLSLKYY